MLLVVTFNVARVATTTPDLDNLIKPVMDVLNELKFWKDDSHVVGVFATKKKDPENMGVHVQVYEL